MTLTVVDCTCSEHDADDTKRDRYGANLHSPYCPVGRAEREAGKPLVAPFGTKEKT